MEDSADPTWLAVPFEGGRPAPEWEEVEAFINGDNSSLASLTGPSALAARSLLRFAQDLKSASEGQMPIPDKAGEGNSVYASLDRMELRDYVAAFSPVPVEDAEGEVRALESRGEQAAILNIALSDEWEYGGCLFHGRVFHGWECDRGEGFIRLRQIVSGPNLAEAAYDALMTLHLSCLRTRVSGGRVCYEFESQVIGYWWALAVRLGGYGGEGWKTGVCRVCGHSFVRKKERCNKRLYCSKRCKNAAYNERKRQKRQEEKSKSK